MGGILSPKNRLFFGIVYGYGARTYSVVTSFGVFVDSTQGHKTTLQAFSLRLYPASAVQF